MVENELASFWKPALSRAFANAPVLDSNPAKDRKGEKTPREQLVDKARALRQQGHSVRDIGKILGIPPSTVFDYLKE